MIYVAFWTHQLHSSHSGVSVLLGIMICDPASNSFGQDTKRDWSFAIAALNIYPVPFLETLRHQR